MRTVQFKDGNAMAWPAYRSIMLGEISPQAAVAAMRREPAGALDAALPRRQARDQEGGKLSQPYCDATRKFLGDNGMDPDDVAAVMEILDRYVEQAPAEDEENLKMRPDRPIGIGGPRGPVGAADRRRFALDELDQFGRPHSNPATPMSVGGPRGFTDRFPDAAKIRTL
jgi:hypothetical protein